MEKRMHQIQSITKAMRLLNILADVKRPVSLKEFSLRADMPKSTVHGLVAPMCACGIVEQEPDGKYRLGIRLFELGNIVSASWNIVDIARPHMQNIALQTGETVQLGMLDRTSVLIVDHADASGSFRVVTETGDRMPAHCTALGKALLAYLPQAEVYGILRRAGMPSYTPHTVVSLEDMDRALVKIREDGLATEDGEHRIGLRAAAVPIFDTTGAARYAIGIIGMFRRVTNEDFTGAQRLLRDAAAMISRNLGSFGDA